MLPPTPQQSMTSPNAHIHAELDRFRKQIGPAFYALQIDAPWGAGKSYFIRKYLNISKPDPHDDAGHRNIYLSLFGARSVGDLERQLFAQLFSQSERIVGSLASTVISGAAELFRVGKAVERADNYTQATILGKRLREAQSGLVVLTTSSVRICR
jgi:hypothetical protein